MHLKSGSRTFLCVGFLMGIATIGCAPESDERSKSSEDEKTAVQIAENHLRDKGALRENYTAEVRRTEEGGWVVQFEHLPATLGGYTSVVIGPDPDRRVIRVIPGK